MFSFGLNRTCCVNRMSSWNQGGVVDTVPRNRVLFERPGRLVSVHMGGGLGNRLFQIMAGLGYAERMGRQFVFHEENMTHNPHTNAKATKQLLLALFPKVKVYRGPVRWTEYKEATGAQYDYTIIPDVSGSVLLRGYFQREDYFPAAARENFKVPRPSECRYDCTGIDFGHAYFVHFRRGDYVNSTLDVDLKDYYAGAVREIRERDAAAVFLVFSDQPAELGPLTEYGLCAGDVRVIPVFIGIWETLYLMSRCTGAICANSTFSWFGAYGIRGDGPVYMPTTWSKIQSGNPNPAWTKALDAKVASQDIQVNPSC
jgi:Glycosyl transferase family 11